MKKDIHPDYHVVDVKLVNGDVVQMRSTYGKEGDQMLSGHRPLRTPRLDRRFDPPDGHRRPRFEVQKKYEGLGF